MAKEKPQKAPVQTHRIFRAPAMEFDPELDLTSLDRSEFYLFSERTFTPAGELLTEKEYDDDGNTLQEVRNTYNEAGKLIHHELFSDGFQAENITYTYNEHGNVVNERQTFEEGFPIVRRLVYDEQQRIIELITEDDDGELSEREVYTYSTDYPEKIVKLVKMDEDNIPVHEEETTWEERTDKDGNTAPYPKQVIVRDLKYKNERRTDYFDARNREDQIASVSYNAAGKTIEIIYITFDENGNELEERTESVNAADNVEISYSYDEHDRVIEQLQRQKDKILLKVQRRFNDKNHVDQLSYRSASRGIYLDIAEFDYHSS